MAVGHRKRFRQGDRRIPFWGCMIRVNEVNETVSIRRLLCVHRVPEVSFNYVMLGRKPKWDPSHPPSLYSSSSLRLCTYAMRLARLGIILVNSRFPLKTPSLSRQSTTPLQTPSPSPMKSFTIPSPNHHAPIPVSHPCHPAIPLHTSPPQPTTPPTFSPPNYPHPATTPPHPHSTDYPLPDTPTTSSPPAHTPKCYTSASTRPLANPSKSPPSPAQRWRARWAWRTRSWAGAAGRWRGWRCGGASGLLHQRSHISKRVGGEGGREGGGEGETHHRSRTRPPGR